MSKTEKFINTVKKNIRYIKSFYMGEIIQHKFQIWPFLLCNNEPSLQLKQCSY